LSKSAYPQIKKQIPKNFGKKNMTAPLDIMIYLAFFFAGRFVYDNYIRLKKIDYSKIGKEIGSLENDNGTTVTTMQFNISPIGITEIENIYFNDMDSVERIPFSTNGILIQYKERADHEGNPYYEKIVIVLCKDIKKREFLREEVSKYSTNQPKEEGKCSTKS